MTAIKKPFFIVNPKSYLYGQDALRLAKIADKMAANYQLDCLFTGQLIDLAQIKAETSHLIITAQHMDSLVPGRGMGYVLPEALKAAGVQAVVLNHAEHPLNIATLDKTIRRVKELNIMSIVCADTVEQSQAIAMFHPTMMICEPTSLIGTGGTSNEHYMTQTTEAIKAIDSNILVMQAAGVSTGEDVKQALKLGADGTGGTSGIIKAPSWEAKLEEMMGAMAEFKEDAKNDR